MKMRLLIVVWLLLLTGLGECYASPTAPTAPTAVNKNVNPTPVQTVNVTSGDMTSLSNAIASAACGDVISVPVATYTFPTTAVNIPNLAASCVGTATGASAISGSSGAHAVSGSSGASATSATGGDDYVIIQSANASSLPAAGTRVGASDLANMPTFQCSNQDFCFRGTDNAHHFIFRGINCQSSASALNVTPWGCAYIEPVNNSDSTKSVHHIYWERSYVQGHPTGGSSNGLAFCGKNLGVSDSRIINHFYPGNTSVPEDHGVLLHCGDGPFLVHNNEISSDTIGVFVGDSYVIQNGHIPSDITITKNWIRKPASWWITSNLYSVGTANIDGAGTTVTLNTGTTSSSWNDVATYFCVQSVNYCDATQNPSQLITNNPTSSTLTLAVANAHTSSTNQTYKITRYAGVVGMQGNGGNFKNLYEAKQSQRVLIDGNVFDGSPQGNQQTGIALGNGHGNSALNSDIKFTNNWVRNVKGSIVMAARPIIGSGTQFTAVTAVDNTGPANGACASACVKLTVDAKVLSATGDTVEISGITGQTNINGIFPMVAVDGIQGFTFAIPITYTTGATNTLPCSACRVQIYNAGAPTSRVEISNNLFETTGSKQMNQSSTAAFYSMGLSNALTYTAGGNDNANSTTGNWIPDSLVFKHNSCVNADDGYANNVASNFFHATSPGLASTSYTWNKITNFVVKDNLCMMTGAGYSNSSIVGFTDDNNNSGSITATGTTALNDWTDSATRAVTSNVFFYPYNSSTAGEIAAYSSPDTGNTFLLDESTILFTSYTSGAIANYKLQAGSTYHNAASDGTDMGVNTTALATAVNGVNQ